MKVRNRGMRKEKLDGEMREKLEGCEYEKFKERIKYQQMRERKKGKVNRGERRRRR
jgi:hypothetical protein